MYIYVSLNKGNASLQYLDDKYCAKVFPGSFDRSWSCPLSLQSDDGLDPNVWVPDSVPLDQAPIDTTTLPGLGVRQDVQACLFLIKRINDMNNPKSSTTGSTTTSLRTRRLCSGGGDVDSVETWYLNMSIFSCIIYTNKTSLLLLQND
jgi:hypothetical protein